MMFLVVQHMKYARLQCGRQSMGFSQVLMGLFHCRILEILPSFTVRALQIPV